MSKLYQLRYFINNNIGIVLYQYSISTNHGQIIDSATVPTNLPMNRSSDKTTRQITSKFHFFCFVPMLKSIIEWSNINCDILWIIMLGSFLYRFVTGSMTTKHGHKWRVPNDLLSWSNFNDHTYECIL